ncbi:allophanate hydrolase [Silicimonas sp. MF1-12-2]|uniref:allophanate hydrolase n=1 Tax=Silicimonas sp. MF1-12-2 TaxID=3384793 RepID=UPI0039B5E742
MSLPRHAQSPSRGQSNGPVLGGKDRIVTFALGTDTAGSGRVPAALNNIVGLKPTLGAISSTGVVPACRTLDTISIFASTVSDAWAAYQVAAGYDDADSFSRRIAVPSLTTPPRSLRVGVPDAATREFFGDRDQAASFDAVLKRLSDLGATIIELDFTPFFEVAKMLYEGAWVAERLSVVEDLFRRDPEALHPVTRQIIGGGESLSAVDAFRGIYRLTDLKRRTEPLLEQIDALCVPTIPTFYSVADLDADPIGPNSRLGTYTNFVNLMDLCGIAVPSGPRPDGRPGSVTLLARAGEDVVAAALAEEIHRSADPCLGATTHRLPPATPSVAGPVPGEFALAVVGAHMSGLPLNHELTSRGGRFLSAAETSGSYRLYALAGGPPQRPGMLRSEPGAAISLEVWAMPAKGFADFVSSIPSPLSIGTIELSDGKKVKGFLVEAAGTEGATDITSFGGWRSYLESV